jgi:hypothetical protein
MAVATQVVADGQVMVPTELTAEGSVSEVSLGVQKGTMTKAGSPPSRSTPGEPPEPV